MRPNNPRFNSDLAKTLPHDSWHFVSVLSIQCAHASKVAPQNCIKLTFLLSPLASTEDGCAAELQYKPLYLETKKLKRFQNCSSNKTCSCQTDAMHGSRCIREARRQPSKMTNTSVHVLERFCCWNKSCWLDTKAWWTNKTFVLQKEFISIHIYLHIYMGNANFPSKLEAKFSLLAILSLPVYLWKPLWLSLKYHTAKGIFSSRFSYSSYPKAFTEQADTTAAVYQDAASGTLILFNVKRDLEPKTRWEMSVRLLVPPKPSAHAWCFPTARSHLSPVLTGEPSPPSASSSRLAMENDCNSGSLPQRCLEARETWKRREPPASPDSSHWRYSQSSAIPFARLCRRRVPGVSGDRSLPGAAQTA